MKWDYDNEWHPEWNTKLKNYRKDKKILGDKFHDIQSENRDLNDYYLFMVRLIYNTFITNHTLTDGNKRMFKLEMEQLNTKVPIRSLE